MENPVEKGLKRGAKEGLTVEKPSSQAKSLFLLGPYLQYSGAMNDFSTAFSTG